VLFGEPHASHCGVWGLFIAMHAGETLLAGVQVQRRLGGSPLHVLAEHLLRINGDEDPSATGEHLTLLVEDFGNVDMTASVHGLFARFDAERLIEGNGFEILDGHLDRHGDDVAKLVHLAHAFVEEGGDDASMAVARRSGVTFAEAEAANEDVAVFVEGEAETHAVRIAGTAGEAEILLQLAVMGSVSTAGAGGSHLL
jgi:hypothetical protein